MAASGIDLHIALVEPEIPPNAGNIIRTAAATGAHLHLIEPLGFTMSDAQLRRAGLDYHDLADVSVHRGLEDFLADVLPTRVFAFTASASRSYQSVAFSPGDVLMFGSESTGLSPAVLAHRAVTDRLRIPMLPGRRSLNLANSVALTVYEAWRQQDFSGSV